MIRLNRCELARIGGTIGEAMRGLPIEGGEARVSSTGEHGGQGPCCAAHGAVKHA